VPNAARLTLYALVKCPGTPCGAQALDHYHRRASQLGVATLVLMAGAGGWLGVGGGFVVGAMSCPL